MSSHVREGKVSSHARAKARKCRCVEQKAGVLQSVLVVVTIDSFRTL